MISRIHRKLGTAGFIISIVALVAALGGGAYAAKAGLTGKQKKEVEAIAKKYAGKPGAPGPAGPAGAKGDAGQNGKDGSNGRDGTDGHDGSDGVSVTTAGFSGAKGGCTEGGIEVRSASPTQLVCNGAKGASGNSGFTAVLPKGETETGYWDLPHSSEEQLISTISFNIPFSSDGTKPTAVYVARGSQPGAFPECPGSFKEPQAEEGYLCLYGDEELFDQGVQEPGIEAGSAGAFLVLFNGEEPVPGVHPVNFAIGSWALGGE